MNAADPRPRGAFSALTPVRLCFLVFMGALLLRLFHLSQQNLWHDEYLTVRVASAPIVELPHLLRVLENNKPPLYFGLMHYWQQLGRGEYWLRLPSAIFGALTCALAVVIGIRSFGGKGVWLGCLLAVAPFHIYYSQEARPFALWGLWMAIALFFHMMFCQTKRPVALVGYCCGLVLACYTFTYAFFIVGFSLLFSLAYRPRFSKREFGQIAIANSLGLLFYLPWLWRVIASASAGEGLQVIRRGPVYQAAAYSFVSIGFGTSLGPSVESLRLLGSRVFREAPLSASLLALGCLVLVTIFIFGLKWLWQTDRNLFYAAFFGVLVFWGTPAVFNVLNPDIPYNPRYAFPALLPMLFAIFATCAAGVAGSLPARVLTALYLVGISASLGNHYFNPAYARDDLRAAAQYLRGCDPAPESIIVCVGYLSHLFEHYYGPSPAIHPLTLEQTVSVDEAAARLRAATAKDVFALVYSRPDHGDPRRILPEILLEQHRLIEKRHSTGVDVYLFHSANHFPEGVR